MGNSGSSLKEREINMLVKKTGYTSDQIKHWYDLFKEECPDGKLDQEKFTYLYKKMNPNGKTNAFYHHVFRSLDVDNSGSLEFDEFITVVATTEHGTPRQVLNMLFRIYDINRNGTIEMRELSEIFRALYLFNDTQKTTAEELYSSYVRDVMKKLDTNRDGVLSKQEFVNGCLRRPEILKLLLGTMNNTDEHAAAPSKDSTRSEQATTSRSSKPRDSSTTDREKSATTGGVSSRRR